MQGVLARLVALVHKHGSNGQPVNMTSVLEAEGMDMIGEQSYPKPSCYPKLGTPSEISRFPFPLHLSEPSALTSATRVGCDFRPCIPSGKLSAEMWR